MEKRNDVGVALDSLHAMGGGIAGISINSAGTTTGESEAMGLGFI